MNNRRFAAAALSLAAVIIFAFQNCGKAKFTKVGSDDLNSLGGPIVCDPFSSPGGCSVTTTTKGLLGNVYYYPNGQFVDDYINLGQRLKVRVLLSKIDIPERAWDDGFLLPTGDVLENDSQQPLIEWFALDLHGFIELPLGAADGDYQFAFLSDDGAILDIGGRNVVTDDGHHASQWKCASQKVSLKAGDKFPIRIRYFQGPRYHITLRLLWRPWSDRSRACNDGSGGLQAVPAEAFSH